MKNIIPLSFSVLILVALLGQGSVCNAQGSTSVSEDKFAFVTTALEKILNDPQKVLDNEEDYWKGEKVQVLAQGWIDEIKPKNARGKWRQKVEILSEMSPEERKNHKFMEITNYIKSKGNEFRNNAIPHLMSFIPETDRIINLPVYFTAYIPPRAFATSEGMVINVASGYWKGNPQNILNCLVHEYFHHCYYWFRDGRTEEPIDHKRLNRILESLQNEGLATYVGYKALSIFPAPDEKDYRLLESTDEVTNSLNAINGLFEMVGSIPDKELGRAMWKIGTTDRGYYIAGAHMAGIIDSVLGRDALLETITAGPRTFVERYNSLVQEDRQIHYPDKATITERENN